MASLRAEGAGRHDAESATRRQRALRAGPPAASRVRLRDQEVPLAALGVVVVVKIPIAVVTGSVAHQVVGGEGSTETIQGYMGPEPNLPSLTAPKMRPAASWVCECVCEHHLPQCRVDRSTEEQRVSCVRSRWGV